MCRLPSTSDKYNALASRVKAEDQNINNRINWLLISESFLVAAIAFLMESKLKSCEIKFVIKAISYLGISLCISVLFGITGAHFAIRQLKAKWKDQEDEFKDFVKPWGEKIARIGDFTRFLVPLVIIIFWVVLLFVLP